MRQKLGLACALIHRPRLLFLDEPTFGVDPISRREFWEILYRLLGTGLTIFLSTAYMDEAERAHRVGLIHRGRLLVVDTPKAIKASFAGELLEARASNLWTARKVLNAHPLVLLSLAMGDRLMVTVDTPRQAMGPFQEVLEQAGLPRCPWRGPNPDLEDLFVQIVRGGRSRRDRRVLREGEPIPRRSQCYCRPDSPADSPCPVTENSGMVLKDT